MDCILSNIIYRPALTAGFSHNAGALHTDAIALSDGIGISRVLPKLKVPLLREVELLAYLYLIVFTTNTTTIISVVVA